MASSIAPNPISPMHRFGVLVLRALMAVFGLVVKLRPKPPAPGPVTNHRYGDHRDETIEVIPRKPGSPKRTPVVYIHGGGWIAGKKELYTGDLFFLADQGHPVFNVEYPMAPERPHPAMLRSLLTALEWIRANYPECESAHFMGDSAGGNLVAMLGLLSDNPDLVRDIDPDARPGTAVACASIVSIYGVLDRLSWIENKFPLSPAMLSSYAGAAGFEKEVGPELAITPMDLKFGQIPPSYLCAGTKDQLCDSTRLFAKRIESSKNEVMMSIFEGEAHGFFNLSWRPASQELRKEILQFISRHESSGDAATAEVG
ncbi:MAG: acetyl esterase/lipase [Myxococcota bacterium]|jgi:acetyl esterase/lipase